LKVLFFEFGTGYNRQKADMLNGIAQELAEWWRGACLTREETAESWLEPANELCFFIPLMLL